MNNKENKNINVLIIEDNPADIRLVSIVLKEDANQPFTIKSAVLLEEGLKLLEKEKFDVVLLDINLPDCIGLGGLEQISGAYPGTPVILLTSLNDESVASDALQKNAADYLLKGQINTSMLVRSIRYSIERNKRENELRRLNRTLHALSKTSQAMELAEDEAEYLRRVCGIIVDDCGYPMVWIGYKEEDEAKTILPAAYAGFEEGYLKTLNLTWADIERGRGPSGTAIRTGKVSKCANMLTDPAFKPWREDALKRGYASSIAIPVKAGGWVLGALTIYSKETDPFTEDDVRLLSELAGYLAFGIMAIRSRIKQSKAEQALKASEKSYRDLIETANSIIIRYAPDGTVSYINDFGLSFFGYTREEIAGHSVMKVVPDSDSVTGADLTRLSEQVLNDPEKYRYSENENIKKNGERAWVIWTNKAVKDERGALKEILCIGSDITKLKNSENQLRYQSEILGAVSDAVIATDLSFNITSWNSQAEKMYGWKAGEVIGKPIKDVVRSEMTDEQRSAIYNKVREGNALPVEVKQYAKDGREMVSDCYSMPIRDASGSIKGYVTVNRDITERKNMEDTLRRSRERLDLALVSSRMATFDWDIANNQRIWSAGVHSLLGTNPENFTGSSEEFFHVIHEEDRVTVQSDLEKAIKTGVYETGYRAVWPDGSIHHIAARGKVHYDDTGKAVQLTGVCWDITERRRTEQALLESEKRYHELFNTMEEGFCIIQMAFDAEGRPVDYRFLETNAAFEKQTGLHGAQGKSMRALAPAHEEHWFRMYGKIAMTGEPMHFENEAKELDRYYDVYAYRVGRPEDRQVAIIFNDISWRKKAEMALQESEEKFRLLAESTPDLILRYDRRLKLLYANQAFYRLTGLSSEAVAGKSPGEFGAAPEAASNWEQSARKALDTGEAVKVENSGAWQGKQLVFELHMVPERGAGGAVQSLITIAHDITERKKMEDTLRESEKRWQVHAVRFSLLSEIAGRLLESPEPLALVQELCAKVMQHLDCQVFFNFIADDKNGKLHLNAYAGIPEAEAKRIEWLDYGQAVCGCVAKDGCRIVAEHIQSVPDSRTELVKSYGVKAYACHPLLAEGGKVMGTLSFGSKNRATFSEADLVFMKTVADHVSVAIARLNFVRELNDLARYPSDSPSPILRISNQGILLFANKSSSLLLETWNCRVKDKLPELVQAMAAQCLGSGYIIEHEITCGDIIYSLIFSPVAAERFVNVYGRDITKRKQAEVLIRKDEAQLKDAQRIAQMGSWELDIITNNLVWSDEVFRIFEKDTDKFKASYESFLDMIHPDDRDAVNKAYNDSLKNKSAYQIIHRLKFPDGRIKYVQERCETIYNDAGAPVKSVGSVQDITERRKMEEELIETRDYLDNLLNYANAPIICWDSEFKITRFNHAFENLSCYKAGEVLGRDLSMLFPHESREQTIEKINLTYTGEHWEDVEIPILSKDGDIRIVLWNSANIYARDNTTLLATIAQGHDITERKKAEEVLKRDKDTIEKLVVKRTQELLNVQIELERSKRLSEIGILAATVAHELRNPLGVIKTAVYNIKRKNQNDKLDSHLANIEKKISESNQIINNLLDYSRIKVPVFEKIKVHSILEECVDNEKEKFEKRKIHFARNIEPVKDLYMEADPLQLKEVFNNILDNACQAIDKDTGRIDVSASPGANNNVIISFKDNGAGIEQEDLKKLFEPFFTRKSKGTGLGLTICSQIISLHSGKIDIESSLGKGTKVTLVLPVGGRG